MVAKFLTVKTIRLSTATNTRRSRKGLSARLTSGWSGSTPACIFSESSTQAITQMQPFSISSKVQTSKQSSISTPMLGLGRCRFSPTATCSLNRPTRFCSNASGHRDGCSYCKFRAQTISAGVICSSFCPSCILAWGICACSVSAVQGFNGMMCARFAIGLAEAGFYPSVLYHMAFWYKPTEMPWRIALFYSVGQLSSALSGLLAFAISFVSVWNVQWFTHRVLTNVRWTV